MEKQSFTALRYETLLNEVRRVLASGRAWQAMPALMDELHRLRLHMQGACGGAGASVGHR